jgi:drug/metabolite transporter (DMT)-like permease
VHPLALILALTSALTHATWNTLTKRSGDPLVFLYLQFVIGALLALPFAIAPLQQGVPREGWLLLGCSTLAHASYGYSLAMSYRLGELSVVYPWSRGLGVACVPLLAFAFLGEQLTLPGIAGILLVLCGILWIALRPAALKSVTPKQARWMTLCGVSIACYAVIDKAALLYWDPLAYLPLILLGCCAWISPALWSRRALLLTTARVHWRSVLTGAVFSTGGYMMVLFALRLSKTAYVIAARETSILFAVLLGGIVLRELDTRHRAAGALSIVAGVVLIALAK